MTRIRESLNYFSKLLLEWFKDIPPGFKFQHFSNKQNVNKINRTHILLGYKVQKGNRLKNWFFNLFVISHTTELKNWFFNSVVCDINRMHKISYNSYALSFNQMVFIRNGIISAQPFYNWPTISADQLTNQNNIKPEAPLCLDLYFNERLET